MKEEKIQIRNMKCTGCADSVSNALNKIKEVKNVEVFLESGTVSVRYEDSPGVRDRISSLLKEIGFPEK